MQDERHERKQAETVRAAVELEVSNKSAELNQAAYDANQHHVDGLIEEGFRSIEQQGDFLNGIGLFVRAFKLDQNIAAESFHSIRIGTAAQWTSLPQYRWKQRNAGIALGYCAESDLLVSCSVTGEIVAADISQEPPRIVSRFQSAIRSPRHMCVSNREVVVLVGEDGSFAMHNIRNGTRLRAAMLGEKEPSAAVLSPDGRYLAWAVLHEEAGRASHGVLRIDLSVPESEGFRAIPVSDRVNVLAFSPDSRILAGGLGDADSEGALVLWASESFDEVASVRGMSDGGPGDDVLCLSFSHDGRILASGSGDGQLRLWGSKTLESLSFPMYHNRHLRSVAFSTDDRRLLAASDDEIARIWDSATGRIVRQIDDFDGVIQSAHIETSGRCVFTTSAGTCRVVDVGDSFETNSVLSHGGKLVKSISVPGGRIATLTTDGGVTIWASRYPLRPEAAIRLPGNLNRIAFCRETRQLAVGNSAGSIVVFDVGESELREAKRFSVQTRIEELEFTVDGTGLLVELPRDVVVFDLAIRASRSVLQSQDRLRFVHLCGNTLVLTESEGRKCRQYRLTEDGRADVTSLEGKSTASMTGGTVSKDGITSVVRTDGAVQFFDSAGRAVKNAIYIDQRGIAPRALSPQRSASGNDSTITVGRCILKPNWDRDAKWLCGILSPGNQVVATVNLEAEQVREFASLGKGLLANCWVDPDGIYAVTAGGSGSNNYVRVINLVEGELVSETLKQADAVRCVAFSATGDWFATGAGSSNRGEFGDVRFYESVTGRQLAPTLRHSNDVQQIVLVGQDQLVSTTWDGWLQVWRIPSADQSIPQLEAMLEPVTIE